MDFFLTNLKKVELCTIFFRRYIVQCIKFTYAFYSITPVLALLNVYYGITGPILRALMLPHPSMRVNLNPIEHVIYWMYIGYDEQKTTKIRGTANKSAATGYSIVSNMMGNSSGFN